MGNFRGPRIVTNGLVFTVDSINTKSFIQGSTTVDNMISSNANQGTLTNGVSFDGTSWTFDGIDDYIEVPDSPTFDFLWDGVSNFTTEQWVSTNTLSPNLQALSMAQSAIPNPRGYASYINSSGNFRFIYGQPLEAIDVITTSSPVSINTWYHVVFVKSGTNNTDVEIYVNGEAQAVSRAGSYTSGAITQRTNFKLGNRDFGGGDYPLNGSISNVKVFNRVLSASEVKNNYNALKWRFE